MVVPFKDWHILFKYDYVCTNYLCQIFERVVQAKHKKLSRFYPVGS